MGKAKTNASTKMATRATRSLILGLSLFALLVGFTNMTGTSPQIAAAIQDSQRLQPDLDNASLSPAARGLITRHKLKILNFIALKTGSRNCGELLSYDRTMISGRYIFYKDGDIRQPKLFECTIADRRVLSATYIEDLPRSFRAADESGKRFKKIVTLRNTTVGGINRLNIDGVRGMPQIVEKLTTAVCKMNVDYGFDANGIWVKNDCSAKFRVPVIMPLSDRTITNQAENLNPVIGRMKLPFFEGDNVVITGWACEKDKATVVNLQLFMGGPAGVGTLVKSTVANLETEPFINSKCDSTGVLNRTAHGFKFVVPASRVDFRRLYVHAVSSAYAGTTNGSLKGSRARIIPPNPRIFPGGLLTYACVDCSFEDPRDRTNTYVYLINFDQASIDQRCIELGYAYGEAMELYTHAESCAHNWAATKFWYGTKWILAPCRDFTVKKAVCH